MQDFAFPNLPVRPPAEVMMGNFIFPNKKRPEGAFMDTKDISIFAEMAESVRAGFGNPIQKEIQCKYFYDEVGSALFETICLLPEYGLARAGERLIQRHAAELVRSIPTPIMLAELGCGSGKKVRWILEELSSIQSTVYFPIEISPLAIEFCRRQLQHLDSVTILPLEKEYLEGMRAVAEHRPPNMHLMVLFLGSSIGNFDRLSGILFLRQIRHMLHPGDAFLLGADLMKPIPYLLKAYNDPIGVTAAFNLNLLARLNRELGANFILSQFKHEVRFNSIEKRIEMHLRSLKDQIIKVPQAGIEIFIRKDETIWTESSHKFTAEEVVEMASHAGFRCKEQWIDEEWPFSQSLLIAE
jgi:dimethylhistidine N-methyltransferase